MRQHVAVLVQVAADHDVLERRHAEEDLQVLERARQARAAPAGAAGRSVTSSPSSSTLAARRRIDAGNHVEQRGLAGAVRTDDGEDLAGSTANDTPSTAFTPPKSMPRSSAREHAHDGPRRNSAARRRHDAGAQEDHEHDHDQAEHDVLVVVEYGEHLRQAPRAARRRRCCRRSSRGRPAPPWSRIRSSAGSPRWRA